MKVACTVWSGGNPGDNFKWALFYMGWGGAGDADEMGRVWTTSPDGNNNNNYGWYSNAEVDQLLADAAQEMDEAKRAQACADLQQLLADEAVTIGLNVGYSYWVTGNDVIGFEALPTQSPNYAYITFAK